MDAVTWKGAGAATSGIESTEQGAIIYRIEVLLTSAAGLLALVAPPLSAQDRVGRLPPSVRSTVQIAVGPPTGTSFQTTVQSASAPWGSQFWIPFGSMLLPGLGQYLHGAPLDGLAYTGTAVAGVAVGYAADHPGPPDSGSLPRRLRDQLSHQSFHVAGTAGLVSAWDAFHRAMPAHREEGRYRFLPERESLGDLLAAPFDASLLGRRTTLLHLAYTGLVTGIVLGTGGDGEHRSFRWHDAAFATALSLNAGVGEEAAFRGWLLPMFHQKAGERFWLANSLQAGLFGLGHLRAEEFALVITAWAGYEGWLTRRNDWSVRESVFHHFWYDVAVVAASLLVDEREAHIQLSLPAPSF